MLKLDSTIKPHTGEKILYSGAKLDSAKYAMILIHGRGASAESILTLEDELNLEDTILVAPQADQFTWYPYRFIEKREVNEQGITSGLLLIDSIIKSLNSNGIVTENIFLLGFSQGSCLTIDYAARYPKRYAGVFVLSGGLIGDTLNQSEYSGDLQNTPVFFGCSDNDFHIPEERVHESADIIEKLNGKVTKEIYPGLGHTINLDEIEVVNKIISSHVKTNV